MRGLGETPREGQASTSGQQLNWDHSAVFILNMYLMFGAVGNVKLGKTIPAGPPPVNLEYGERTEGVPIPPYVGQILGKSKVSTEADRAYHSGGGGRGTAQDPRLSFPRALVLPAGSVQ